MKYSLKTMMIVVTLIGVVLGIGLLIPKGINALIEQRKKEVALANSAAYRAEVEKAKASIGNLHFQENKLLPAESVSVPGEPATEQDYYGRWKCVGPSGKLVLELRPLDSGGDTYKARLLMETAGGVQGKSFHHQGPDQAKQRLLFVEEASQDFIYTKGECALLNKNRLQVRGEFLVATTRYHVDATFVRVDRDDKLIETLAPNAAP